LLPWGRPDTKRRDHDRRPPLLGLDGDVSSLTLVRP
jgi:hypothetical protein